MPSLADLPPELIQHIHLLALNPFLPLTCVSLHAALAHPPASYAATYLLELYAAFGSSDVLVRSLRHPVCSIDVAKEIKRIWDRRRGFVPPSARKRKRLETDRETTPEQHQDQDAETPTTPRPTAPPLRCSELPRRLFRNPTKVIPELLLYLFAHYEPSPNSHKGYPLSRAVLTSTYSLAAFLLSQGADPTLKSSLAIEVAVSMKDLRMVKLLIERTGDSDIKYERESSPTSPAGTGGGRPKRRRLNQAKRPRLSDRVVISTRLVDVAMRKGNEDIVRYFVHEKGVMPPLDAIMKLGQSDPLGKQASRGRKLVGF